MGTIYYNILNCIRLIAIIYSYVLVTCTITNSCKKYSSLTKGSYLEAWMENSKNNNNNETKNNEKKGRHFRKVQHITYWFLQLA